MANIYTAIDQRNFKTPDMGEYYDEDLIEEMMSTVDPSNPKDASYYMETPFSTILGYDSEYEVFVLKADPIIASTDSKYGSMTGAEKEALNEVDADTLHFYLSSVSDGGRPFEINGRKYMSFKDYAYNMADHKSFKDNVLKVRTIGIDAPEVPHYSISPLKNSDKGTRIKNVKVSEFQNGKYAYEVNKKRDKDSYPFINISGSWREIIEEYPEHPFRGSSTYDGVNNLANEDTTYYKYIYKDEQVSQDMDGDINLGLEATRYALELLNNATDIRIILDAKQLQTNANYSALHSMLMSGWNEDNSLWDIIQGEYIVAFGQSITTSKYAGFTTFGQDAYKRFLGAIYVEVSLNGSPKSWVNLAKYVKSKVDRVALMTGVDPVSQDNNNNLSDAFKVWSYDNSNTIIADGFSNITQSDFDDRRQIQKEITGIDFSLYRDYTMMIGDCLFMVPPTSVRVVNQIESNRVPLLRSKGSMIKTLPSTNRIIEMTLYFNDEHGINGMPIKKQLPRQVGSNNYETYYMNGLRSLIAMFKYTPFLPIENSYLNDTLGIEAVSLVNIQMQTMPMYPKCLAVTLTLQQFNYRIYLNELPLPNPEKGESYNENMYAKTINYGVMRHYYQGAIAAGEAIKDLRPNSQDFINQTMGSKTKLIPMEFKDQNIKFQILDTNWLDKMKSIKKLASKQAIQQTAEINLSTKEWAASVGKSLYNITRFLNYFDNSSKTKKHDKELDIIKKELMKNSQKYPHLINVSYNKGFKFVFDTKSLTKEELNNLMIVVTNELEIKKGTEKNLILSDGTITFPVNLSSDKESWTLNTSSDEYKIAEFFAFRSGMGLNEEYSDEIDNENWTGFSTASNEAFYEDIKDNALDMEGSLSAKFRELPLDIIAQQFSISLGNTISSTRLKMYEGYAPQYSGGQDTIVDFVFHTQDESVVTMLNAMQEMAAQQLMQYREVINCWPIRIDSEMTRLCGIYEVVIESVDISTVPMQPGLFAIQCRAISVDRTMRNREALKKIDEINNAGATNESSTNSMVYNTYFDLNNVLSKAEVYPDLELPTIDELESTGYKFIRYMKTKDKRVYPDPDFYFVYGYTYSSQILRKSIVDHFDKTATDEYGNFIAPIATMDTFFTQQDEEQEAVVKMSINNPSEVTDITLLNNESEEKYKKEVAKNSKDITGAKQKAIEIEESKKKRIQSGKKLYDKNMKFEEELISLYPASWDICSAIKCTLPEDIVSGEELSIDKEVLDELKDTETKIIEFIDGILYTPINADSYQNSKVIVGKKYQKEIRNEIKQFVKSEFKENSSTWKTIFGLLGASIGDDVEDVMKASYEAAAMALSGNNEYSKGADKETYIPRAFLSKTSKATSSRIEEDDIYATPTWVPNSLIIDSSTGATFNANSKDLALKDGITFGPFQIRRYDTSFLRDFYLNEKVQFNDLDFIDPYYNKSLHREKFGKEISEEEYSKYKEKMMISTEYSVMAFHRIVLAWVKKLILDKNYISFYDIRRDNIKKELDELVTAVGNKKTPTTSNYLTGENTTPVEYYSPGQSYEKDMEQDADNEVKALTGDITDNGEDLLKIVGTYEGAMLSGKIFLPVICATIHGDKSIYEKINAKDVGTLKVKTRQTSLPYNAENESTEGERNFRKLIRGLSATNPKILKGLDGIASESYTKLESAMKDRNEKLWLTASEDPSSWVLHSFYDMVVTNKRGRMARAFPTYYMMLIDEGREIGYWKLHDNFYNMNSISEIEVTKSRKIAADTANIVMTNMFKTFSTEDEDIRTNYESNIRDVFNSIFSPNVYFEEEEAKRMAQMNINKATLKPGVRIHLRMGYSGDASELPILFNGVIAEASNGELINIVAQGDGHEIVNPQAFSGATSKDVADLKNESSALKWFTNFFTEGATPKELITNIFTTKSGIVGTVVNNLTNGRFFNDNMFGITHFGEIDFKAIHKNGEIMQNIYEAEGRMPWQTEETEGSLNSEHASADSPKFTIALEDKSVWDMMNICAGSSLEFMTGIAPFGLRSTIFFGRPHYYYAYDYDLDDKGILMEKRKPFQQFHIIDSYSDIIGNNIKANGSNVKTVAVPTYRGPNLINIQENKKLKPIWADWDIYPEYQKTTVVNTGISWKGNKAGALFFNNRYNAWSKNGGEKIAWRMGATALKNSFKDMYEGEVIIIGDTSIKPLDKVYLHDAYENMNGTIEVEAVVHRLSPETGFTSSVFADCISCVDSRYERIGGMWTNKIAAQVVGAKAAIFLGNQAFGKNTKPILNILAKTINKSAFVTADTINKIAQYADFDDIIKHSSMENWSETFYKALNLSSSEVPVWNKLGKLEMFLSKSKALNLDDSLDVAGIIDNLVDFMKLEETLDVKEMAEVIQEALDNGTINKQKADKAEEAVKALSKITRDKSSYNEAISSTVDAMLKNLDNLDKLPETDEFTKMHNLLKGLKGKKEFDASSLKTAQETLKYMSAHADDAKDFADAAKLISTYGDEAIDFAKAIDKAIDPKTIKNSLQVVKATAAASNILLTVAWMVVEAALTYTLEKSVYNWIENQMASFNVLTVYPLRKNNVAHVAGIDGHKGLVVGSPSWNQAGAIDTFFNWVFQDREGLFPNLLKGIFISDNMTAIYNTYKSENRLGNYADYNEDSISGLLKNISESQASSYSSFKSLAMVDRISDINSPNAKYTYKKTRIKSDLEDIPNNSAIMNDLVPIDASNEALSEYFLATSYPKLKTIHLSNSEYQEESEDEITYEDFKINNAQSYNGVFRGIKLSENTVDIPFLRPDAFQLFKRILDTVATKLSYLNYGEGKDSTIWFKSGTIVNHNTWSSTGYVFRFEATNIDNSIIENTFKDIELEFKDSYLEGEQNINLFQYKKVGEGNTYEVYVSPRDEYIKLQI